MKSIRRVFLLLLLPVAAVASEGGLSNYIPGFYGDLALAVEPPEGLSIRNDVYHYTADAGASVRSGQIEASVDIDATYNFLTFLYNPYISVLGSHVTFGVTLSVGYVDIDANIQAGPFRFGKDDNRTGFGDVTFASTFYWNMGKFNFAWSNYLVTPTGVYDEDNLANIGLNYYTIETDFMATYFNAETGQNYSIVVG